MTGREISENSERMFDAMAAMFDGVDCDEVIDAVMNMFARVLMQMSAEKDEAIRRAEGNHAVVLEIIEDNFDVLLRERAVRAEAERRLR